MRVLTSFLLSASAPEHFPAPGPPEIAFIGRSNVGKSSLINSLVGEKIAKTSSTPGRTRTINFFGVRRPGKSAHELMFADLPGYGYAKLSKEVTATWPQFIEPYLAERPTLRMTIVLVDSALPPQPSDQQMVEWLAHQDRSFMVVATKADKLSGNELTRNMQTLKATFGADRLLPYSARTGLGKDELWRTIFAAAAT